MHKKARRELCKSPKRKNVFIIAEFSLEKKIEIIYHYHVNIRLRQRRAKTKSTYTEDKKWQIRSE